MSRWHGTNCHDPVVVIERDDEAAAGRPRCQTCQATPDLEEISLRLAGIAPIAPPPADEPRGRMKLWWPPSVPYTEVDGIAVHDGTEDDAKSAALTQPTTLEAPPPSGSDSLDGGDGSFAYASTLDKGSFRIACLTAASNPRDPMHLDLEEYELDNCPEYEAVSYTWAGEESDSSNSQPVYVGPYWDILLQTRNCLEMLRFLRPARGSRLVWVDAVCINQLNVPERSTQVANMGRIYSDCSQVVVYLGLDIAPRLPPGRHPRRRKLQDFGTDRVRISIPDGLSKSQFLTTADDDGAVHLALGGLLQRRYFSRLWVIQELILSKRVVMRVGDVDFWTDTGTKSTLEPVKDADGEKTEEKTVDDPVSTAPWFQYLSQGVLSDKDVIDLSNLTRNAHCADARDHLFGLAGLLPLTEDGSPSPISSADYSLSCQHVYIGLFSHLIINEGLWRILSFASGVPENEDDKGHSLSRPSWAPNWTSHDVMSQLWTSLATADRNDRNRTNAIWDDIVKSTASAFPPEEKYLLHSVEYGGYLSHSLQLWPSEDPQVDVNTGALGLTMTRFLKIQTKPVLVGSAGSLSLFEMRDAQGRQVWLYSRRPLDRLVHEGGTDALYASSSLKDGENPMYLILREQSSLSSLSSTITCALVASCPMVMFTVPRLQPANIIYDSDDTEAPEEGKTWKMRNSAAFVTTLDMVLQRRKEFLDNAQLYQQEQRAFIGLKLKSEVKTVFEACLDDIYPLKSSEEEEPAKGDESVGKDIPASTSRFPEAYRDCLDPRFEVTLSTDRGMIGLALHDEEQWKDWDSREPGWGEEWIVSLYKCYERGQDLPEDVAARFPDDAPWLRSNDTWRLVVETGWLKGFILAGGAFQFRSADTLFLGLLRRAHLQTGEPEEQLWSRDAVDNDKGVIIPLDRYSRLLLDDFGCTYTTQRVHVL